MEHPDIASAQVNGYATFSQPSEDPTELDREGFVKDNAGLVVQWMLRFYPEILEEYITKHETFFRRWLN